MFDTVGYADLGVVVDGTLRAAVDSACDAVATPGEAGYAVQALHTQIVRLQAALARAVGVLDAGDEAFTDLAVSSGAWLRHRLHLSPSAAAGLLGIARALPHLPQLAAACAEGAVAPTQADIVGTTLRRLPADVRDDDDTRLLVDTTMTDAARQLDPLQLRRVADYLVATLAPDAADGEATGKRARRRLHMSTVLDGMLRIDGLLDPESAAIVTAAFAALATPPAADDERIPAQRRADDLVELCNRQLAGDRLPDTGGLRPQLVVTIGYVQLKAGIGAGTASDGRLLDAATVRRLACDAGVIPAVLGGDSQPLDIGRTTRTVPRGLRHALNLRDGGCAAPGCNRSPGWTDAHHIEFWGTGGATTLDNLVLLCRQHHTATHQGRLKITPQPGQRPLLQQTGQTRTGRGRARPHPRKDDDAGSQAA